MHKDQHLVFACLVKHFFVHNIVHGLESLECLLFGHSNVLLLQRHRAETVVKVEEALKKTQNINLLSKAQVCNLPNQASLAKM